MITTELFALGLVVKLLLEFFSKREERAYISKTFTLPTPFEEDVVNFLVKFMRPSCSRGCFWIPNLVFWNHSTLCAFLSGMKRSKTIFVLVFLHFSGQKGEAKSRNRPISDSSLTPAPIKSLSSRDLEMKFNSTAPKRGRFLCHKLMELRFFAIPTNAPNTWSVSFSTPPNSSLWNV